MSPAPLARLTSMESLRGVAVSMVLLQHLPYLLPGTFGWWLPGGRFEHFNFTAGVDIFFCLSGFVVVRALRRDLKGLSARHTMKAVGRFWVRRAFRIWPTAWLWLILAAVIPLVFNRAGVMNEADNLREILPGIGMYLNITNLQDVLHQRHGGTLSLYWTLSQEEQFYFVFPLILAFGTRVTLICLFAFISYSMIFGVGFLLWFALRLGSLLAGVLLAFAEGSLIWRYLRGIHIPHAAILRPLSCMALCLWLAMICAIHYQDRLFDAPLLLIEPLLLAVFSAVLVGGAALGDTTAPAGRLGRILLGLGRRSYVIYAVHPVAYAMAREVQFRTVPASWPEWSRIVILIVLGAVLLMITVEATVRLVEQPLRLLGRRLSQERPAFVSAT